MTPKIETMLSEFPHQGVPTNPMCQRGRMLDKARFSIRCLVERSPSLTLRVG